MAIFRRKRSEGAAPLDGVDVVLADLDGVVYAGQRAIPHAVESLNAAAESVRVGYITNNASRTDASVAEHLTELGLHVQPSDIVTSPQAAVRLLAQHVAPGSSILVVGGDGLVHEVEKAGFAVVRSADDDPAAVIQGFHPDLGWKDLAEASFALQRSTVEERPWVATNTDWTIPVARGIAPGNGTLVSAVHTATGRLPLVAGKPEVAIFEEATARFGATVTALHRRPARHGHPRREPGGHPVGARAHGDRPCETAHRRRREVAPDVHPRGPPRARGAVPADAILEGRLDRDGG